jgi:hypothetical protein
MSLDIKSGDKEVYRTSPPAIYVGGYNMLPSMKTELTESSRNYLTLPLARYTRCTVKYQSRDDSHILCRHVVIFCFDTGFGSHYSPLHFKLRTQITLARIQFLQLHFQYHIHYSIRLNVCVCKHTATLCTTTSLLLLLGVVQCCDQHSIPGYLTTFLMEPVYE